MGTTEVLIDGLYFGEGPRWRDDRLWFSDFYDRAVKTVGLDGSVDTVVDVPNQPSGLGWLPDGRLLVVSMLDRKLLRLEAGGLVEHADLAAVATYHCNDMVVRSDGTAYVGNFGFDLDDWLLTKGVESLLQPPGPPRAVLARIDPDGAVHVAASDLLFPNGAVITPDGSTLIVAETIGMCLTAFDLAPDGTLGNRRVWAQLPAMCAPDGICLDAEGAVWLADALGGACLRVREGGAVVDRVETSQPVYACMLGGPERRTLFALTAASSVAAIASADRTGKVEIAQVAVAGAGLP